MSYIVRCCCIITLTSSRQSSVTIFLLKDSGYLFAPCAHSSRTICFILLILRLSTAQTTVCATSSSSPTLSMSFFATWATLTIINIRVFIVFPLSIIIYGHNCIASVIFDIIKLGLLTQTISKRPFRLNITASASWDHARHSWRSLVILYQLRTIGLIFNGGLSTIFILNRFVFHHLIRDGLALVHHFILFNLVISPRRLFNMTILASATLLLLAFLALLTLCFIHFRLLYFKIIWIWLKDSYSSTLFQIMLMILIRI